MLDPVQIPWLIQDPQRSAVSGRLAVQMYTLRDAFEKDAEGACRRIQDLGIQGVELFALGEPTRGRQERIDRAHALRSAAEMSGLEVVAAHTNLPTLDDPDWILEEVVAAGASIAVAPAPDRVLGFTRDLFAESSRLEAFAERLRAVAAAAADKGVRVAFHNHWTEWATDQVGAVPYDRFAEMTGDDVLLEVDALWARAADQDPAEVIGRYAPRVFAIHLKDAPSLTPGDPQCALGEGVVDVRGVMRAADAAGAWHVLENDVLPAGDDVWRVIERSARWWHGERQIG